MHLLKLFDFQLGDHVGSSELLLKPNQQHYGSATTIQDLRKQITQLDRASFYTGAVSSLVISLLGIKQVINNDNATINMVFGVLNVVIPAITAFTLLALKNATAEKIDELKDLTRGPAYEPPSIHSPL